jgi:hypothetical protein
VLDRKEFVKDPVRGARDGLAKPVAPPLALRNPE